jgi:hypothetical protein
LVLCKSSIQIQPELSGWIGNWIEKETKRLGLGMDLVSSDPGETGRAYRRVGMDLRPAPLQEAAGGWTDEPRRAATGGERRGRSGARFGGACSAAVQVRGKREEARVPLSGDGVHVHSVGPTMLRGPWP